MSFLDRFKKREEKKSREKTAKLTKEEKGEKRFKTLKPKTEASAPVLLKEKKSTKAARVEKHDTKQAYRVLISPVVTEKATTLVSENKYAFEVAKDTNKIEIRKAIKNLYGFEPADINIVNMRGKKVNYGRVEGRKKAWKKAIVTLKKGDKIEIYEGV
jgi:large subunit ribosomal protein L23